MDLNEESKIQCFNCHADILPPQNPVVNSQQSGPVCEECLHQESKIITTLQMQIEYLEKQSSLLANNYQQQGLLYISKIQDSEEKEIEELEAELAALEKDSLDLISQQQEKNKQLSLLIDQYDYIAQQIDKQGDLLRTQEVTLKKALEDELRTILKTHSLRDRHETLNKLHLLPELYLIHYDQCQVYINKQQITFKTSTVLLEIISLLAEKYNYQRFKVNFCDNKIKTTNQQIIPINTENEQTTIP